MRGRLTEKERGAIVRFLDSAKLFVAPSPEDAALLASARAKMTAEAGQRGSAAVAVDPRQLLVPGTEPAAAAPEEEEPAETHPLDAPGVVARPFLKWAGGKRQLVPELLKHAPAWPSWRGRYIEPFVGGGALFFALCSDGRFDPERDDQVILADSNRLLIGAWRGVRDDVSAVVALLRTYRYDEAEYYARRKAMPSVEPLGEGPGRDDAVRAAWMIYINRCCFNGVYRVNAKGEFNVPFGRYTNPTICDEEQLRACSAALQGVHLLDQSFEVTMAEAREGDFIYCDPPYAPVGQASFTAYTAGGFGPEQHIRLRDAALAAAARGAHVLLSNADTPFVRELYRTSEFEVHEVNARRSVNSAGKGRGKVGELILAPRLRGAAAAVAPELAVAITLDAGGGSPDLSDAAVGA